MEPAFPGPDGFLLERADSRYEAHLSLNEYLLSEEQRDPRAPPDFRPWRKLPQRRFVDLIAAVLCRLLWLEQHDTELETGHLARNRLRVLLRVLYSARRPYQEPDLRLLLDLTVPLLGLLFPYGPVEQVVEYFKSNDLTPELCSSLRLFQSSLVEEMSESQTAMQLLRQRLHMLLWFDEWEPLDPSRCWSEAVRRDYRAFEGARRAPWRQLLRHLRGDAPVRMPGSWARAAGQHLAALGVEDFRDQIGLWFAPFRSAHPLPISVPGSHVLKGLIWYCALSRDEACKASALGILETRWKPRRTAEKVFVALTELGVTREELRNRKLIPTPSPDPGGEAVARMLALYNKRAHVPGHVEVDPDDADIYVVQGDLHFYRVSRSTGRIERTGDRAVIELDYSRIPDSVRNSIRRECDSEAQVLARAFLLQHDALFGSLFREKK